MPQALIDAYFEAEDLRNLTLAEKLEHCVLSLGLAKRLAKREKSHEKANGKLEKPFNKKRKRHSFSRPLSDSETDDILESLSFPDQPGDIEGEPKQSKITSCKRI